RPPIRLRVRSPPREPRGAASVQALDLGTLEGRHVALDREAEPGLQVGQMTIALGKLCEEGRVELELYCRIEDVEAILLVNGLAQHDRPRAVPPLEKVVKATRTHDVAGDAVDGGALRDRHLGLRDGSIASHIDRRAAQEMQDVDALVETLAARLDEALGGPLEPGRHHHGARMPYGLEALPVAGV